MLKRGSMKVLALLAMTIGAASLLSSRAIAAEREIVSFRLAAWKSAHLDEVNVAKAILDTLKSIGCEVKQQQHGGHFDVTFRCPTWRSIALKSHAEAHQWERWLKAFGFETAHKH